MRADVVIGSSDHRSTIWHQPKIYRCVTPLCDKISEKTVTHSVLALRHHILESTKTHMQSEMYLI